MEQTNFPTLKDAVHWIEITDNNKIHEYHLKYIPATNDKPECWHVRRKIHNPIGMKIQWVNV